MNHAKLSETTAQANGQARERNNNGSIFSDNPMFAPIASKTSTQLQKGARPINNAHFDALENGGTTSDECATLSKRIHNDNFNIKFKIHMINKMLDEGSPASPQLLEELRNMENRMTQSQQRYDRLEKKIKTRKRRNNRQEKYGQPTHLDRGEGSLKDLDDMSFSAVEREHNAVERKFQEVLGKDILDLSIQQIPSDPGPSERARLLSRHSKSQPQLSSLAAIAAPKFSHGRASTPPPSFAKSDRLRFDLPASTSPEISSLQNAFKINNNPYPFGRYGNTQPESPPRPRKVTRFSTTTSSDNDQQLGANHASTPVQSKWNMPNIHNRQQTPGPGNALANGLNGLTLGDNNRPRPRTRPDNRFGNLQSDDTKNTGAYGDPNHPRRSSHWPLPRSNQPEEAAGLRPLQNPVEFAKDREVEIRELREIIARQNQQLSDQAKEIDYLEDVIVELEAHLPKEQINFDTKHTNRHQGFEPTSKYDSVVVSKLQALVPGLTQIYDSVRKVYGVPTQVISLFQETILDLVDISQHRPPTQSHGPVPIEAANVNQQLTLYQYENTKQKNLIGDLQFINQFQAAQIKVYQNMNKTRIEFLRSIGLLPPAPAPPPLPRALPRFGRGRYSWQQPAMEPQKPDTRAKSTGRARLRALVYCVMAARRFQRRLDQRNSEKQSLKLRLSELQL